MNAFLPEYLQTLPFVNNSDLHNHNTRGANNLFQNRAGKDYTKECIHYDIPITINDTPVAIKCKLQTHSYTGFSRYTKNNFITKYSEVCNIVSCYICGNG